MILDGISIFNCNNAKTAVTVPVVSHHQFAASIEDNYAMTTRVSLDRMQQHFRRYHSTISRTRTRFASRNNKKNSFLSIAEEIESPDLSTDDKYPP